MDESETLHRRRQFSLRVLLLWTTVIALYLGLAKSMNWNVEFLEISVLVAIIALLRAVAGTEAAAIGSLVGCGFGLVLFLLIESTFLVIERLNLGSDRKTQHTAAVRQGLSASSGFGLAIGALLVGMIGSAVPVGFLLELWQERVGVGIRPIGLPLAMVWCGLGTPIIAIWFSITAYRLERPAKQQWWRRLGFLALIALSLTGAFLPLFLTTFGANWSIQARSLWLKP